MTLQEIQTLVAAGYTKSDIEALTAQVAQPVVQPQPQPAVQPQPQAQPEAQQVDFATTLQALGALINKQGQQPAPTNAQLPASMQPVAQPQAIQPQVQPVATTPSNAGLTSEEATKLFQAWSMGAAMQNVELPPTADDILKARFESLYGVDTSNTK